GLPNEFGIRRAEPGRRVTVDGRCYDYRHVQVRSSVHCAILSEYLLPARPGARLCPRACPSAILAVCEARYPRTVSWGRAGAGFGTTGTWSGGLVRNGPIGGGRTGAGLGPRAGRAARPACPAAATPA